MNALHERAEAVTAAGVKVDALQRRLDEEMVKGGESFAI